MGVYYAFSPDLNYKMVKEFLEFEKLEHLEYKDDGDSSRNIIEVINLLNVDYLIFHYRDTDYLKAHSSHYLEVIKVLEKLSSFSKCEIESDIMELEWFKRHPHSGRMTFV